MDIIQNLYLANDIFVGGENAKSQWEKRLNYQQAAMTKTRLLSYFALLAMEQKVILPKQYHIISVRAYEVMQALTAWVRSDKRRFEKNNDMAKETIPLGNRLQRRNDFPVCMVVAAFSA